MYYPEFLTQNNLYTNGGEYILTSTGENYTGYYWRTFDGKFFTGKNPQQTPNQSLSPITQSNIQNSGDSFIQPFPEYPKNNLTQRIPSNPKPAVNRPTSENYENGFYYRYVSKPINSYNYIEVNQNTYNLLIGENPNINYILNNVIKFRWILVGNSQDEVYKQNKLIVEYTEKNSDFKYLGQFLKFNYTKYYQG